MKPKGLINHIVVIWNGKGWIPQNDTDIILLQKTLRYAWGRKKFNRIKKIVENYEEN